MKIEGAPAWCFFIMAYLQLINPNYGAVGYIGECEAYAEAFFGTTIKEPTARAAWDAAQFKHPGEQPPAGVIVPMFWNYLNPENNYHNDGHVAGSLGDGRIQSSPWQQGTTHAVLSSRAELERIYSNNGTYPLTYLGWSEDISNVRVIKENDMLTPAEVNQLCQIAFNRPANDDEKSVYSSIPTAEALQRILDGAENIGLRTAAQAYWDKNVAAQTLQPGIYKVN